MSGRVRLWMAIFLGLLVATGCGSRRTTAEVKAAHASLVGSTAVIADRSAATEAPAEASVSGGPAVAPTPAVEIGSSGSAEPSGTGSRARVRSSAAPPAGGPISAVARSAVAPRTASARTGGTNAPTAETPGKGAPVTPATNPTAGGDQACKPGAAPMVLGSVGQMSGIVGAAVIGGTKAVQAWVAAQNRAGGFGCHPVRYVTADDGGDPSRQQLLVKQLVEQEGVVAFVFMTAVLTGQASAEYLQRKQVPVIGGDGGATYFNGSPMHFSPGAVGADLADVMLVSGAALSLPKGRSKLATITCQEATFCNVADSRWQQFAPKVGYKVVYQSKASITQPDFTSQCLSAQSAGADVIAGAFDPNSWKRIAGSCAQVGYKPTLVSSTQQVRVDFPQDPAFEGMVVANTQLPWFLDKEPAIAEFSTVMKRYASAVPIDAASLAGWASAKLFERAAQGRMGEQATSAEVLKGLWSLRDERLGGLTPPLTFTKGSPAAPLPCGWAMVITNGKWTNDGQQICQR